MEYYYLIMKKESILKTDKSRVVEQSKFWDEVDEISKRGLDVDLPSNMKPLSSTVGKLTNKDIEFLIKVIRESKKLKKKYGKDTSH